MLDNIPVYFKWMDVDDPNNDTLLQILKPSIISHIIDENAQD